MHKCQCYKWSLFHKLMYTVIFILKTVIWESINAFCWFLHLMIRTMSKKSVKALVQVPFHTVNTSHKASGSQYYNTFKPSKESRCVCCLFTGILETFLSCMKLKQASTTSILLYPRLFMMPLRRNPPKIKAVNKVGLPSLYPNTCMYVCGGS